jgi:hypothetical protein
MTPDELPIPDDDALAGAARRALGRLSEDGPPVAPWEDVRMRGRRAQRTRAAVAIAAALLVVVAGAGGVSALHGKGDHVDVAGTDPGGTTTTTEAPTSTTAATTTTVPHPSATTPEGGTAPVVIPQFPEAQAGDFEGTLQVASTTLTATQPMPVTLTLRNISDHAVYIPGVRPIGVFLGSYSATGMTGSAALFAPGETRTYTSTITANPDLIGAARLSAAFLEVVPLKFGTSIYADLAGVAPADVTIVPPGWQPGQPLDPSQGSWNVVLSSDVDHVTTSDSLVLHVQVTNTGDQPQQTFAYGALAVSCPLDRLAFQDGTALPAATLAPGELATFDVTVGPAGNTTMTSMNCSAGLQFPTYDGSAGDPVSHQVVGPRAGIISNTLPIALTQPAPSTSSPTP